MRLALAAVGFWLFTYAAAAVVDVAAGRVGQRTVLLRMAPPVVGGLFSWEWRCWGRSSPRPRSGGGRRRGARGRRPGPARPRAL